MNIIIGHKDLIGPVKEMSGIAGANVGVSGCTAAWSKLEQVGTSISFHRNLRTIITHENNYKSVTPFTDKINILVRQGGIKEVKNSNNENLNRIVNTMFREDVFPSILKFVPGCTDIFNLRLNYNNSYLISAEIC